MSVNHEPRTLTPSFIFTMKTTIEGDFTQSEATAIDSVAAMLEELLYLRERDRAANRKLESVELVIKVVETVNRCGSATLQGDLIERKLKEAIGIIEPK